MAYRCVSLIACIAFGIRSLKLTSHVSVCSMEYYMQKTFYKTASLMANSCKSIAILADQPAEVATLAFEYGRHLVYFVHLSAYVGACADSCPCW